MTIYLALLRGINVSGQKSIRMPELQSSFLSLGFSEVRTYVQSGNVVFCAGKSDELELASMIAARIKKDFGHVVPVLAISDKALDQVVRSNPLWPKAGGDEKLFHCTFLSESVSVASFKALKFPAAEGERAVLVGRAILLHCPHGYGNTKLNNNYFERALGVAATTRNWRTVLALQKLCSE